MKKVWKKHSFFTLSILVLLSAAMALSMIGCAKDNSLGEGEKAFTVEVYHENGEVKTVEVKTDKKTVGDALVEVGLIAGENGPYGLMIKTVDGETHDSSVENKYWAFYINGEYAMSGVDSTDVEVGAVYAFKVETF